MQKLISTIVLSLMIVLVGTGYSKEPPLSTEKPEDLVVILRILPDVSSSTLSYVANLSEPERYEPFGTKSYKEIARLRYGVINDKICELMRKFNPQLHSFNVKPKDTVYLPAGPRWSFKVKLRLPVGSSISQELVLQSGYAGEKNLSEFFKANPGLDTILDSLPTDMKLIFPYVARVVAFRLKPEYASNKKEIEKKLNGLHGIKNIQIIPSPKMTHSLTEAHLASIPTGNYSSSDSHNWHYANLLYKNDQILISRKQEALVAVLDTGIPHKNNDSRLYDGVLWKRKLAEMPADMEEDDQSDNVYGAEFLSHGLMGFPEDDHQTDEESYHGTHVAGLLAGSLLSEEARKQLKASMKLMILKVVDHAGNPDVWAILDAIIYANKNNANIVNMSFELEGVAECIADTLKSQKNTLFVVSAGNAHVGRGHNIDAPGISIYPAKCSANFQNVITVAAHDEDGKLAFFSNWGKNTVDLAAPGLHVESLRPGSTQMLSGTSQAAALVSLSAALLYSAGVVNAADIKQLLITSANYDPDLKNIVRSEGRLNSAKALAVLHEDVIRLNTGELIYGKLQNRDPLQILSLNSPLPLRNVRKIIFNYSIKNSQSADLILSFNEKRLPDRLDRFEQAFYPDIFPLKIKQNDGQIREILRSQASELVLSLSN
jgi:hypothetical protein